MRHAVDGFVQNVGSQIVQQQNCRVALRKIMLQGEDLAAITKRILCKQTDLLQAVEHDTRRLGPFHGLENSICRLA